jgi:DNA-binding transcriptional ArsR family regulator
VLDLQVIDLQVIDDRAAASDLLDPTRADVLRALAVPGSATTVAQVLGETRQKVNYHIRTLEEHGLVRLVEERPRRGLTERVVVASASSYVMSPSLLGATAPQPVRVDRLSARYALAVASRLISEISDLTRKAERAGKRTATLTIDIEIKFASAASRADFTAELTNSINDLAARYHDEAAPRGRWHRLVVASHAHPGPAPADDDHRPPRRSSAQKGPHDGR